VLVGVTALQAPAWIALLAAIAAASGLRVAALASGFELPRWSAGDER
jgi:hypothetical protein